MYNYDNNCNAQETENSATWGVYNPKLTEVADEALEVDKELHIGDEEAVDSGHVGHILHERLGVVGAEQAVGDRDAARQGSGLGVRLSRRVSFLLIHGLLFLYLIIILLLLLLNILPLFWKIFIGAWGHFFNTKN